VHNCGVRRQILLVDDDIAQISLVRRVLARAGHEVRLATNASDALASMAQHPPELALVALGCENGEGRALARQIADAKSTRLIPLVLLGDKEDGSCAAAVPLPVNPVVLESALRTALSAPDGKSRADPPKRAAAQPVPVVPSPAPPQRSRAAPGTESAPASPTDTAAWFDFVDSDADTDAPSPVDRSEALREEPRPTSDQESERLRQQAELAQIVERAAAEEEATEQLRIAEKDARRAEDAKETAALRKRAEQADRRAEEEAHKRQKLETELARLTDVAHRAEEERRAAEEFARRAAQEAEAQRTSLAESARRRVLALAKERTVAPGPRPSASSAAMTMAPELAKGSLEQVSMPRLLALAARTHASGRLEVATDPVRSLWFEGGRIVGAASELAGERTEEVAFRLGLITREQQRQAALAASELASRRVGVLLLERGFLKGTELALLARGRTEEIAFALFLAGAPYRFLPGERVPPDERITLDRGTLALALEGVRRRWTSARLEAVLGGPSTLIAPAAEPPTASELGLSPEECRVAELADGLRTLDEILADSPLDPLSARQALAALVELGYLEVKILTPSGPPTPSLGSIDLARVDEKLDQVRRADYFTILGVGRLCTPYEVRKAAERLLSELSSDRFGQAAGDGLVAKLEEIRQVVGEARDILSDDLLRSEYQAGLGE